MKEGYANQGGCGAASIGGTNTLVSRSSALDDQLERWERTTASIHDRIQHLECRLGRILAPPAPATECVKGESGCGPNELTRQMDVRNNTLAVALGYLEYVIDRIDL